MAQVISLCKVRELRRQQQQLATARSGSLDGVLTQLETLLDEQGDRDDGHRLRQLELILQDIEDVRFELEQLEDIAFYLKSLNSHDRHFRRR